MCVEQYLMICMIFDVFVVGFLLFRLIPRKDLEACITNCWREKGRRPQSFFWTAVWRIQHPMDVSYSFSDVAILTAFHLFACLNCVAVICVFATTPDGHALLRVGGHRLWGFLRFSALGFLGLCFVPCVR